MQTRTDGRALYRVRRFAKGRGFRRYFTQEEVAYYKKRHPDWRFRQLTTHGGSQQVSSKGTIYNNQNVWGKICSELAHNRVTLRDTSIPAVSYDDILDVQLALKKGI